MNTKSNILSAVTFVLCAAGIGALPLLPPPGFLSAPTALLLASLLSLPFFLVASVVIFYRPRVAYGVALAAAILALAWLVRTELALSPWINSWITLNASSKYDMPTIPIAVVKILASACVLFAFFCTTMRLLPARWAYRGRPVAERTWPAVALTAVLMATWFVWAARPYRLPEMVDLGPIPTLRILHVAKRGLQLNETFVSTSRDGRFWISRDYRRLFRYQFQKNFAEGVMPPAAEQDVNSLLQSLDTESRSTQSPKTLQTWNAEGWYVIAGRPGFLTFTTENGTTPPPHLVRVFRELERLTQEPTQQSVTRDICLGFCYDPAAGLGFTAANQRCFYWQNGYKCN